MAGIGLPCLATSMVIVGVDMHKASMPIPSVMMPHLVLWFEGGIDADNTSRDAPSVQSPGGSLLARAHDAAPWVPHIPPSPTSVLLIPAVMAASSSRCEFGVGSVQIAPPPAQSPLPVAIALLYVIAPQLHCQDIPLPPLPTGIAIAIQNTSVLAGFTLADLIGSLLGMLYDILVQWLINYVVGKISGWIAGLMVGVIALVVATIILIPFEFFFGPELEILAPELAELLEPVIGAIMDSIGSAYIGAFLGAFIIGSPMGWCGSWTLYNQALAWGLPSGDDAFNLGRGLFGE